MNAYTPTTEEVRATWMRRRYAPDDECASQFDRWLAASLATITPNPDDPWQVEVVARALCLADQENPDLMVVISESSATPFWRIYEQKARAVLTALKEVTNP